MSLQRISAILLQEIFITKRSLEVIVDLFYFSIITVVVFGFVSFFLTGKVSGASAYYLIIGMLLWEVIRVSQYSISVGALWNIWSRNLSSMFVSPLRLKEYVCALLISAVVKAALVLFIVCAIAAWVFKFNILQIGVPNLVLFFLNLTLFSWSVGLLLLGLIFLFGTRIQALAWGFIFLFQPLGATFFPVKVLPGPVQIISYLLPITYIFEAARAALLHPEVNWTLVGISFVLNIVYLAVSVKLFLVMYDRSKETGQFARNEG